MFARIVGITSFDTFAESKVYVDTTFGDPDDTLGVPGGHFDVDTASNFGIPTHTLPYVLRSKTCINSICPQFDDFNVDGHKHAYDNAYDTKTYNARNPLDSNLHRIQNDTFGQGDFKIIIANADLSPGIDIIINGVRRSVTDYALIPYSALPTFNSSTLTELSLAVSQDSFDDRELHRTIPECARANIAGANGEWRNGALTVQAIKDTGVISSTVPHAGGQGVAESDADMLHEIAAFWHEGSYCYNDPLWLAEWNVIGKKHTHFINY
jgi:hypothetical protein